MANERTYPCLPCPDLDQAVAFYEALGFQRTYRQLRPNPYAVVAQEDIHIHLFGMENFDPANSYGSVIIVVPDPDALYHTFAAGLRAAYGKLPLAGIPRLLRPRKRFGTVRGFSVVDPGGNWLRISKLGDTEEKATTEKPEGLARILETAARLGDAHGDDTLALKTLENGLIRFKNAPAIERARALLFRAELAVRLNENLLAQSALCEIDTLTLTQDEQSALADEREQISELAYTTSTQQKAEPTLWFTKQ
jgi:catechol 2,3-dioxygenase-like lactoylglutathione lyase family enzyme